MKKLLSKRHKLALNRERKLYDKVKKLEAENKALKLQIRSNI